MDEFFITFARNHNREGLPDNIHNRVIKVKCKSINDAHEIAKKHFNSLYSMIYLDWTVQDSINFAPLGVTHEIEYHFVNDKLMSTDLKEIAI